MSDGTDWCRHYHGIGKICEAGVDPQSVRVDVTRSLDPKRQRGRLYPCFEEDKVAGNCPRCSYLTPEERTAEKERSTAVWTKYLNDLANNVCPFCGAAIEKHEQIGRCAYAKPCGHRLYQGRV